MRVSLSDSVSRGSKHQAMLAWMPSAALPPDPCQQLPNRKAAGCLARGRQISNFPPVNSKLRYGVFGSWVEGLGAVRVRHSSGCR